MLKLKMYSHNNLDCIIMYIREENHYYCECSCHYTIENVPNTEFSYVEDADISNPPDEVTWYSLDDPNASWNLPK